jgi:predicted transcriptional regulator
MDHIWAHPDCSADACREALAASSHHLKDSSVRTLLQRLEQKGYLRHQVQGRTYLYRASEPRRSVAAQAVKQIVDRLLNGSVEQLLVGMVENHLVDRAELKQLAKKIASKKRE